MRKNKFKVIFLLIISILIIISGTFYYINQNVNKVGIIEKELSDEEITFGYGQGLQVVTSKSTNEDKVNGKLRLDSSEDPLDVIFENFNDESEYIMKVLYDFKEIEFQIIGETEYVSEYRFKSKNNIQNRIPIKLSKNIQADKNSHNLTISFFSSPDTYEKDVQYQTNSYGISLDHQLIYTDEIEAFQFDLNEYENNEKELDLEFSGLMLNQDFTDYELVKFPDSVIKSNPNEEITLAYRAGRLEEFPERYAIVMYLDWEQQLIDKKPYKLIQMKDPEKIGYGTISFTAPSEKGFYEIVANIIPDPNTESYSDNFFPLENSYRFTLEVK